jgi:glycosyltransferase involved in cell wall biosynthesis
VQNINPDTVLSFGEIWNNLVLIALKGLDVPVFISDRSQPDKDLGKFHNYLRNKLYPQATGYIAQTQKAKEVCLLKGWNTNVKVIGNPIRKITADNIQEKENIVLSVGRLIKTKHFDQLIDMFVEICNPNWKLVIVGGDAKKQHLSKELKNIVKGLGAEGQVILTGEQKDIDSYYRKSKIFAFTSSSEGFPNVVGEALSAGLPVVAYDCNAGPADMITDGENGFLVPLFDQKVFKQKLQLLMGNETLRRHMGDKTSGLLNHFDEEKIADHFFTFITQFQKENVKVGIKL